MSVGQKRLLLLPVIQARPAWEREAKPKPLFESCRRVGGRLMLWSIENESGVDRLAPAQIRKASGTWLRVQAEAWVAECVLGARCDEVAEELQQKG